MVPSLVAFVFSGLLATEAGLNLTPMPHTTPFEEGPISDIAFHNGPAVIVYRPPAGWQGTGDATRAVFRPSAIQSEAVIEAHPKPAVPTFDEASVKELKAKITASLPPDASKIEWAEDEPNPMLLNTHPTYRISFSYSMRAQRFTTSILVCNFAEQQVRFQLTAREADFKSLYTPFRQSIVSFQGLK